MKSVITRECVGSRAEGALNCRSGDPPPNMGHMYEIDDQIVVSRVLEGDRDAFGMLVTKYQTPIYNLMRRTVNSTEDAAELAQEVFLKAFARLSTYQPRRKKFFSWLYTIGLNVARDHLRRQKRQGQGRIDGFGPNETHWQAAVSANPEQQWVDIQTLQQALSRLSLDQRETLVLKYRHELTMQEIAGIFGISVSAVKMRVQRGLTQLRRQMATEV